jgi:site-specific recombinase XerD
MLETLPAPLPDPIRAEIVPRSENQIILPALIQNAGEKTARRYLEFFLVSIRNQNTRAAYGRAVSKFFTWCEAKGLTDLQKIEPLMVAAFIEQETKQRHAQTVKQELAAIKGLFDYLVIGQIIPFNPASSVRGPAYSIDQGKTPVLRPEEVRALLDSIPTTTKDGKPYLVGLRDRALIGVMIYTFARVSAVVNMTVADYRLQGKRSEAQLHEKGGVFHKVPMHHMAQEYLDAYVEAASIGDKRKTPLFRSAQGKTNTLTENAMHRNDALRVVKRRAKAAGLPEDICCHSWRATGITNFRFNGGTLENAQAIANHKSPRTTKLYDRTGQDITQKEIERMNF